jgi:hypothetical protein
MEIASLVLPGFSFLDSDKKLFLKERGMGLT